MTYFETSVHVGQGSPAAQARAERTEGAQDISYASACWCPMVVELEDDNFREPRCPVGGFLLQLFAKGSL